MDFSLPSRAGLHPVSLLSLIDGGHEVCSVLSVSVTTNLLSMHCIIQRLRQPFSAFIPPLGAALSLIGVGVA